MLKQSNHDIIRETVDEYPKAALHNCKIKKTARWQPLAAGVIFPVWLYLYMKAVMQKNVLRSELQNIMSINRNLVNELSSVVDITE